MNRVTAGAISGLVATLPMTAAMVLMHRKLPAEQRYPLPPYQITTEVARRTGVDQQLQEDQRKQATLTAHYGFGALSGAFFPLLGRTGAPWIHGSLFGVAVWALSYLGWVPATRLMAPATRQPKARVSLMILAHVVWGSATALTYRAITQHR